MCAYVEGNKRECKSNRNQQHKKEVTKKQVHARMQWTDEYLYLGVDTTNMKITNSKPLIKC